MLAGKQCAKVRLLQEAYLVPVQFLRGSTAQHSTAQHGTAQHNTAQLVQCSRMSCFLCQVGKLEARHETRNHARHLKGCPNAAT